VWNAFDGRERCCLVVLDDCVMPGAVDLDALCLTLSGNRVVAAAGAELHDPAGVGLCDEAIRSGMHCGRKRGHEGLHRWASSDAGRSFVWG
jgi:hypothetical protein